MYISAPVTGEEVLTDHIGVAVDMPCTSSENVLPWHGNRLQRFRDVGVASSTNMESPVADIA